MYIQNIPSSFDSYKKNSNLRTNGSKSYSSYNPSFTGRESQFLKPFKDAADGLTTLIAKGLAPIIDTKVAKGVFKKTKDCKNLTAHLSAFTSLVLSSFYVGKTLTNDNLEENKRRTLAINQTGTFLFSTISAYTIDKVLDAKIGEFKNRFKAVNIAKELPKDLDHFEKGIRAAKSIIIFGTMYRFIAPVLITPIANAIGNILNEKEAKTAKEIKFQKQA